MQDLKEDLFDYYNNRKKHIEANIIEEAVQIVKGMKNAKCLNSHDLEFVFSLDDVIELKDKIKCRACMRSLISTCESNDSKSDGMDPFKMEAHCYVFCVDKKKCHQYFCENCVIQESLVSERFLELGESVYSASYISMIKDSTQ